MCGELSSTPAIEPGPGKGSLQKIFLEKQVLKNKHVQHRVILQSFDVNILEEIHLHFSDFKLAYLVETGNYEQNKNPENQKA